MDEIKVFKNVCERISPSEQEKERIYRTILEKHRSSNSAPKYIVCFLALALILLLLVFGVK